MFNSNYDIRQCINNIEFIMYTYDIITDEIVDKCINIPKLQLIKDIISYSYEKNINLVLNKTKELYDSGYSANDIILTFMKYIENDDNQTKINHFEKIYKVLSEYYIKINLIDNLVQLSACIVEIYEIINHN